MWDKSLLLIRRDCSRTFKANEERSEKGIGESDEGRGREEMKTEGKRE